MIERIDNVGVAVTDLERAVAFYTRLGFKVEDRDESTHSAMLPGGEARLWLFDQDWGYRSASVLDPDENCLFLLGDLKGR